LVKNTVLQMVMDHRLHLIMILHKEHIFIW